MMNPPLLDLNLATRPLRNRRLFKAVARALVLLIVLLAGLSAFVMLKFGGQASRLRAASAEARATQAEADREQKRLEADIKRASDAGRTRVDLVNGIILRKAFLWTDLFTEIERALPGPSYITALSPSFSPDGSVAMHVRVTSRSLEDLAAFITNLTARGFKNIQVGGETRDVDGRLIAEMDMRYERAL